MMTKINIKLNIIFLAVIVILIGIIVWQYIEIKKMTANATKPPLPFPYHFYDARENGIKDSYVSAKGTWESNLKLAFPYNMNEVNCWKDWNQCIMATAYTTGNKSFGGENMINADMHYFEIVSWDSYKIIAKNTAMCAENVLTVDRTIKKITSITTPINTEMEVCKKGKKLLGEVEVQTDILIDGSTKWINEFIANKK